MLEMNADGTAKTGRTGWIWAIALFFGFSSIWTVIPLILIKIGAVSLPPVQKTYLDSLTTIDYALTFFIAIGNLAGALMLFFLRKTAFHFFVAGFAANLLLTLWQIGTKGWAATVGGSGFGGTMIGWMMVVAVLLYIRHLSKEERLI